MKNVFIAAKRLIAANDEFANKYPDIAIEAYEKALPGAQPYYDAFEELRNAVKAAEAKKQGATKLFKP